MLDRIVEYPGRAGPPFTDIVADTEGTTIRDDQRHMNGEPCVGATGMWWDAGVGLKQGEKSCWRETVNLQQRQRFQNACRLRALRTMRCLKDLS